MKRAQNMKFSLYINSWLRHFSHTFYENKDTGSKMGGICCSNIRKNIFIIAMLIKMVAACSERR